MPCLFQASRCEASDEFATSTAWTLLAYSWPMRWNTRSAPVRSTRTSMPPNFLLERGCDFFGDRQIDRGVPDHLAFFFRGLDQLRRDRFGRRRLRRAREANTVPSASAVGAFQNVAPDDFLFFIASSLFSGCYRLQRAAALGRQRQPDLGALGNGVVGRGDDRAAPCRRTFRPCSRGWRREKPGASRWP